MNKRCHPAAGKAARYWRPLFLLIGVAHCSCSVLAGHPTLLPQPAKITYGTANLAVRGLVIRFGSRPNEEDRFAADQLSHALSARAGVPVTVRQKAEAGRIILLIRAGSASPLPLPGENPGPASREAYELKVTSHDVRVQARSSTGLFYAVQTLGQLVQGQGSKAVLPEVEIQDWPSVAYRGVMVDMSHGPLPTEKEIQRQIDFLAQWKINQYYFYNEASIELNGYPLLNPDGRFTQDQVRRVIEYGRARHVDVIPCLELYGHLHDLLRIERYSDLGPFAHGEELNPLSPKVRELLADWTAQFTRLFPSPFVHIGFDETWQIAMAAKKEGAGTTPEKLLLEQLRAVAQPFQQQGKTVMAWADMMLKYPSVLPNLPPGLIAVPWHYEPANDYSPWLKPLVANAVPELVQTGVQSWYRVVPDFDMTEANIDMFSRAAREARTLGLINSLWTDDAQGLMRLAWPGLAYGAAVAWQQTAVDRARFFADYSQLMYPEPVSREIASALEKLSMAETHLEKGLGKGYTLAAIWENPFSSASLQRSSERREDLHQARLLAEEAQENLYRALSLGGDPAMISCWLFAGRQIDYAGLKFLQADDIAERWKEMGPSLSREEYLYGLRVETYSQIHNRLVDLMDEISELRQHYKAAWLDEYTPYRLESALGRWDAEYQYWRAMQVNFRTFWERYKPGEPLPSLESVTQAH